MNKISEQKDRPDYRSKQYQEMAARWPYVCDCLKGTLHMRSKGELYLPKFPAEDKQAYEDRLKVAVFFNGVGKTLRGLVGMIFRKPPTLGEDVPEAIKAHLENVDLAGTHWRVFAQESMESAGEFGHSVILVDMQPGQPQTHADDFKGRRPFWVQYDPGEVINWRTINLNGETKLQQITFEEVTCEANGNYKEKQVTRYRVFKLLVDQDTQTGAVKTVVAWELHRKVKQENGEETVELQTSGTLKGQNEIPVAVHYGRKKGFLKSTPPLLDLAHLNIKHYQQQSEYDNTLHIVGYPMLWSDDADEGGETSVKAIGPSVHIRVPKGCQVGYAEPQGSSLEAQRLNLEDKKKEMAVMGLSFLAKRVESDVTATERVIDNSEEKSELSVMASSLKDALERCLGFHALYLGKKVEQGGSVEMVDPSELMLTNDDIRLLSDQVFKGQLSLESLWAMMNKAGKLPADFDAEQERARIGQMPPAA